MLPPIFSTRVIAIAICGLLLSTTRASWADNIQVAETLAQAQSMSAQTGKPIFAVAGKAYCPHCVSLMKRLQTDQSLAKYGPHFVMIKVAMDDDPAWPIWNSRYPVDRNAIPRLYVIRSDGKELHADVGAPSGDSLPRLLEDTLQKSAEGLAPGQTKQAQETVDKVAPLVASQNWSAAWPMIESALRVNNGPASHSPARIALLEMQNEIVTALQKSQQKSFAQINAHRNDFDALIAFVDATETLGGIPAWSKQNRAIRNKVKRMVSDESFDAATQIAKARTNSMIGDPKAIKLAVNQYAGVLKVSTLDPARQIATDELRAIAPEHAALSFPKPSAAEADSLPSELEFRTWTSAKSASTVSAKLLQQKSGYVQLQTRSGKKISLPITELSGEDQDYIRSQKPGR